MPKQMGVADDKTAASLPTELSWKKVVERFDAIISKKKAPDSTYSDALKKNLEHPDFLDEIRLIKKKLLTASEFIGSVKTELAKEVLEIAIKEELASYASNTKPILDCMDCIAQVKSKYNMPGDPLKLAVLLDNNVRQNTVFELKKIKPYTSQKRASYLASFYQNILGKIEPEKVVNVTLAMIVEFGMLLNNERVTDKGFEKFLNKNTTPELITHIKRLAVNADENADDEDKIILLVHEKFILGENGMLDLIKHCSDETLKMSYRDR
ncbi:MAG: hypothetical protein ACHP65_08240, partial [Legionellales bacterium]